MIAIALDVILVAVLIEAAALSLYHRRTGRGIAPRRLMPNLAAGFCLMLAVRVALAGSDALVAVCLMVALIAHLADLAIRWSPR